MFSRCLLAHAGPLGPPAAVRVQVCSRSLSSLRLAQPSLPFFTNSRRFSAAPAFRAEDGAKQSFPPPSGRCFIKNVPYRVTAAELEEAFSEFGKIKSVAMLTTEAGLARGSGFVEFESVAEAIDFVEAHEADPIFVLDRQISVTHAIKETPPRPEVEPSDTLVFQFRGDLQSEARSMFGSFADRIMTVRFSGEKGWLGYKYAFIQFRNVDVATQAMDTFKDQNGGTQIRYATQKQPSGNYTLTSRLSQHSD